ncbi:MAG: SPFH domain-containing protein [Planctomycetota bacterium]|nr:SPFH domain-containing protein [Planctomycetota bacterium]
MNKPFVIVIGLVLLASLLLFSMTFTIKYHEVGIKTRFGKATDGVITEPGLGFKWPKPINSVITLDKRLQMIETPLETIQTADGQQLVVRAFMLWKINEEGNGPLDFYNSYATTEDAEASLRNEFRTAVTRGVSNYRFNELIGADSKIAQAESDIRDEMKNILEKGVVPVTIGFRQMSLSAKTTRAVVSRMNAERKQLAQIERIKGQAEAQRIKSEALIDIEKIMAFANQRAEEIRAQGDIRAARYLDDMSEDEDLAVFLVWIDALERILNENTTFILETNVAPFHLADQNAQVNVNGIPMPEKIYDISQNNLNPAHRAEKSKGDLSQEDIETALAEKGSDNE